MHEQELGSERQFAFKGKFGAVSLCLFAQGFLAAAARGVHPLVTHNMVCSYKHVLRLHATLSAVSVTSEATCGPAGFYALQSCLH